MWRKCSLGLMVRAEDKASHPSQKVSIQERLWWPLLLCHQSGSAQWVPLACIKHLPECHTSLATSQVTPFQL